MIYRNIASVGAARKRPGSHELTAASASSTSVGRDSDPVIVVERCRAGRMGTLAPATDT